MKTTSKLLLILTLTVSSVFAQTNNSSGEDIEFLEPIRPHVGTVDAVTKPIIDPKDLILFFHKGGNGGDSIGTEFNTIARNALNAWRAACRTSYDKLCDSDIQFESLLTGDEKTNQSYVTVLTMENPSAYDEQQRDAVNKFHQGRGYIFVNEKRWTKNRNSNYEADKIKMLKLVLHEYFSLIGLDSSDYYENSNIVANMIIKSGINIESVTNTVDIAPVNSVYIVNDETFKKSTFRTVVAQILDSGYELSNNYSNARFIIRPSVNCEGWPRRKCVVSFDMEDTYKKDLARNFYSRMAFGNEILNKGEAIKEALEKIFTSDDFPIY